MTRVLTTDPGSTTCGLRCTIAYLLAKKKNLEIVCAEIEREGGKKKVKLIVQNASGTQALTLRGLKKKKTEKDECVSHTHIL